MKGDAAILLASVSTPSAKRLKPDAIKTAVATAGKPSAQAGKAQAPVRWP